VIYQGRALPLAWRVRQCPKGHFPEDGPAGAFEQKPTVLRWDVVSRCETP
jgi:hypothetical protein